MSIKTIFGKLQKVMSSSLKQRGEKRTPNEVELASFKERERLDLIQRLIPVPTNTIHLEFQGVLI